MIQREVAGKVLAFASQYPVVAITGPRQSGKSTLCRMLFPDLPYVSLEMPDQRDFASQDPRGFLDRFTSPVVIDEVQRVPELLSVIQVYADQRDEPGQYILTGSQNFLLLEKVSQSLAGRAALVTLLPFTLREAYGEGPVPEMEQVLYTGFYPRIFHRGLNPTEALGFYVSTYVERDVRQVMQVRDLSQFEAFLRMCAGRTGQVVNLTSLGNDVGITHNTVRQWLSILEASWVIKLLHPYHHNLGKRLIRAPKLHFLDTGLAAHLLSIHDPSQLESHPLKGALLESYVVAEILKHRFNRGMADNLYYLRDSKGFEVDVLLDEGTQATLVEVKAGKTVHPGLFSPMKHYAGRFPGTGNPVLVYGGHEAYLRNGVRVLGWREAGTL